MENKAERTKEEIMIIRIIELLKTKTNSQLVSIFEYIETYEQEKE